MKLANRFSLLLGLSLLLTAAVSAQTPRKTGATLTGIVLGADGKPVPGASVTCESSGGLRPRATHTDAHGKFFITGLKQDSYDLRATSKGAYSDWQRNIPLRRDSTKNVTLQLLNGNTSPGGLQPAAKKQ